jgi:Rrf2 family protein
VPRHIWVGWSQDLGNRVIKDACNAGICSCGSFAVCQLTGLERDYFSEELSPVEITRKTDYAIRLIAALIIQDGKPLSVREAAEAQNVPYTFARSIQHDLVLAGFVRSLRGTHGGMLLAKDPDKLTLLELIEAVQGPVSVAVCAASPNWCDREQGCRFHPVWEGANDIIRDYLSSVTIKELLEGKSPYLSQVDFARNPNKAT